MNQKMPSLNEKQSEVKKVEADLDVPAHEEEVKAPEIIQPGHSDSTVKVPSLKSNKPIEVVALRKGFYNQTRYNENDKFKVKSEEDLGSWMKCIDPELEKKRVAMFKNKKAIV